DRRTGLSLILKANLKSHHLAQGRVEFFGNSSRHRCGGQPPRLRMPDQSLLAAAEFKTNFRQLRGFSRPGLAADDNDLMRLDCLSNIVSACTDRQGFGKGNGGQWVATSCRRNTSGRFCCHGKELKLSHHYNFGMNDTYSTPA